MSLVCHECGIDVQPGDELPGREGGMINPNMIAAVWTPDGKKWASAVVPVSHRYALCFSCITKATTAKQKNSLNRIYSAYTAEVNLNRFNKSLGGMLIQYGSSTDKKNRSLEKRFHTCLKRIDYNTCLCCSCVINFKEATFFTFKVMDRVRGENKLSGFGSYQWSKIKTGETSANICFNCCQNGLPNIFKQFSNDFMNVDENTRPSSNKSQLFVSPEVLEMVHSEGRTKQ